MDNFKSSQRIAYLDIARAVAIFSIVLGHTLRGASIYTWLYSFHVPLCIIISGICFKGASEKIGVYLVKKFSGLMLPYYCFAVASICIYQVLQKWIETEEQSITLLQSVLGMLWGNGEQGLMRWNLPLWYIPMFFVMEVLAYFVYHYIGIDQIGAQLSIFLLSIAVSWAIYAAHVVTNLPFGAETALYCFPCFAFGVLLKSILRKIQACPIVPRVVSGAILVMAGSVGQSINSNVDYVCDAYGNYILFLVSALAISVGIIVLCTTISRNLRIICYVGSNTLPILLMHKFPIMFFAIMPPIKVLIGRYPLITSTIISLLVIFLCMIVEKLIICFAPAVVGKRKNQQVATV